MGTRLKDSIKHPKFWPLRITDNSCDTRFAKPIDQLLITQLARDHEVFEQLKKDQLGVFSSSYVFYLNQGL